ncbi:hypothetical protein GRJ2_000334800 [Grus japonensis]|uniref:Uncharacterized protein n=1 Tax=Grus japonensis TaxID=30415 RepID=A0ABC9W0V4_GRUJA
MNPTLMWFWEKNLILTRLAWLRRDLQQQVEKESVWTLEARTDDTGGLQRGCFGKLQGENLCSQISEFKLVSSVKDNKKDFLKYVNSKTKIRDSIGPLLDEVVHLTNKDVDIADTFNAFFDSVFNTNDELWEPWSPVLEDHDSGDDKLLANPEVV